MNLVDVLILAVVVATVAYSLAFVMVVRSTRDPAVGITLLLTLYWTLVGALPLLLAKRDDPATEYSYLEDRLFFVLPDRTYTLVLLVYSLFLGFGIVAVALLARPISATRQDKEQARWQVLSMSFSHALLLAGIGALVLLKLAIVVYLVRSAGTSLYSATRVVRGGQAQVLRIYQYLNFISAYSLAAAFALWLCFSRPRAIRPPRARHGIWLTYSVLLLVTMAENALLGNRAVPLVMMAAIAAGWIRWRYLAARPATRGRLRRRFLATAALGLVVIGTIGISRGGSLDSPSKVARSLGSNFARVGNVVVQETRSSEKLAAHMSLYGVLAKDDPPLQPLAPNSYAVYTGFVGAPADQVFTVHYVTAWWLRLGAFGLVGATITFAGAVAILQRLASRLTGLLGAAFSLVAATLPAAGIPIIVLRSGPEALRAVAVELVLLPALVLVPCFLVGRRRGETEPAAESPAAALASVS